MSYDQSCWICFLDLALGSSEALAAQARAGLDTHSGRAAALGSFQLWQAPTSHLKEQLSWTDGGLQILAKDLKIHQSPILITQNMQSNENQNQFPDTLGSEISIQEFYFTTNALRRRLTEGHSFMLSYLAQARLYWKVNENNNKYSLFFNIQNLRS